MKKIYLPVWLSLIVLLLLNTVVMAQSEGVSDARFARLAKGVNITRWFWLNNNTSDKHYQNYVSDDQLQQIRDAGFTHVRLVIDPEYVLNEDDPTALDAKRLAYIQAAVERIIAHDLAVIIDVHNWQEDFNTRLTTDPDTQQAFADMWRAMAAYFSDTDPDMVFLEVMNEPHPDDPSLWPPIQEKIAKAMREGAPEHTIIVGGSYWNDINGLKMLEPLDDPNIIYNFHFYEPFFFTHQGADWAGDVQYLHDIPYPSTDNRCGELPDFGNDNANDWANWYCTQDTWDAQRIDARIQEAVNWAKQWNLRLTCNEFGVNPPVAPPEDRLQWLTDVRTTFEKYNIGWSLWGYDDGLGFDYNPDRGLSKLNPQVLQALGMSEQ